MIPTTAKI